MRRSHIEAAITAGVAIAWSACALGDAPTAVLAIFGTALLGCAGYVWCEVLFGWRIRGVDRAAVAAGLAFALPVLGGLVLQAAGEPLHRPSWGALFVIATLVGDAFLLARRAELVQQRKMPRRPGRRRANGAIYGAAVVVALGAVALAWEGAHLQRSPAFTQLWLVPARSHPALANLGVSNHQGRPARFRLVLLQRHGHRRTVWDVVLADGQTWSRTISVRAGTPISASLYRLPDLRHPFREVSDNFQGSAP